MNSLDVDHVRFEASTLGVSFCLAILDQEHEQGNHKHRVCSDKNSFFVVSCETFPRNLLAILSGHVVPNINCMFKYKWPQF